MSDDDERKEWLFVFEGKHRCVKEKIESQIRLTDTVKRLKTGDSGKKKKSIHSSTD